MASLPAKKNAQLIFYISLPSQVNPKVFQTNPTLATGDVKVSTNGGTEANITTLPVVTPAGSKRVKVTLSATEMNGDNIQVTFSDASGAEWCDVTVDIPTSIRQVDDLALESGGNVAAIKAQTEAIEADTQGLQTQVGVDGAGLTALGDVRLKLLEADVVVDTAPTPWELVWIEKDSGALGIGNELLRKEIRGVEGAPITSVTVVPGQQVSAG